MNDIIKKAVIFGMVKDAKFDAILEVIMDGKPMFQTEMKHGQPKDSLHYTVQKTKKRLKEAEDKLTGITRPSEDTIKKAVLFGLLKADKFAPVCDVIFNGKSKYQAEVDHKQPEMSLKYPVSRAEARLAEWEERFGEKK